MSVQSSSVSPPVPLNQKKGIPSKSTEQSRVSKQQNSSSL